ncbi:MAG TPA: alpha/beta hydrolase [Actinoplanes sp.]
MPSIPRLVTAAIASLAVAAGPLAVPASAVAAPSRTPAAATAGPAARTAPAEARRVDRVRTPKLRWYSCYAWAQCATTKVPLDYDRPYGKQTTIALLRVKARDQKHKIGSLFVNPGGPGVPATDFALLSPLFLSDSVLQRFDVVGMDPRGIGASSNVNCFGTAGRQTVALKGMRPLFPYGKKEEKAYVAAAKAFGKACSNRGRALAGAMSTAEVARDMDVMRRAVGDRKLSYLGFSYGTAIGQFYAGMFPDRFRAIAVDGVINPRAWVGSKKTGTTIQDERLRSADGAYRAFVEIMRRCDLAGAARCAFANGNPLNNFATITRRLKAHPVVIDVPLLNITTKVTYADFVGDILDALYSPTAGDDVTTLSEEMWLLTAPAGVPAARLTSARTAVAERIRRREPARAFPYQNAIDAYASVTCTDGRHPKDAGKWPTMAAKADRRAPYFGRAWAWASVMCARRTWTVRDEDAYTGPFTKRTANTVLMVGSYWDPATNYRDAVIASRSLPNSRLLSSNNWGHTAYGTSACATGAVDRYLLHKTLPAKGTVCVGEDQPFTAPLATDPDLAVSLSTDLRTASVDAIVARGMPVPGTAKQLPPVGRTFTVR